MKIDKFEQVGNRLRFGIFGLQSFGFFGGGSLGAVWLDDAILNYAKHLREELKYEFHDYAFFTL